MDDNRRKLYDALSADYDMGTYDQFAQDVQDESKRRKLYDAIKGEYDLPDFDGFSTQLLGTSQAEPQQRQGTPSQQAERFNAQPMTPHLMGRSMQPAQPIVVTGGEQQGGRKGETQTGESFQPSPEIARIGNTISNLELMRQQHKQALERMSVGGRFGSGTQVEFNPETGKLENASRTLAGTKAVGLGKTNEDIQMTLEGKQPDVPELQPELEDAYAERERLDAEYNKRLGEIERKHKQNNSIFRSFDHSRETPYYGSNAYNEANNDPILKMLNVAKSKNEERIKTLERERDNYNFAQTLGKTLFSLKTWDFGLGELAEASTMLSFGDKQSDDPAFLEAQKSMLDNTYKANVSNSTFGANDTFWQRAGDITANAIPFVAEFMITGGGFGAATKLGPKLGAKYVSRLGVEAAQGMTKKGISKMIVQNTGTLIGDFAASMAMANTTGAAKTYADILERHQGQLIKDDDGEYIFDGRKSWGRSIYEGEMANILEYYTEKLGAHLDGSGASVLKWLSDKNVVGAKSLSELFTRMSKSDVNKMFSSVGVNEYPSEVIEEEANILLNSILVGDNKFSDFVDGKTQADILGGMFLSIGFMKMPTVAVEHTYKSVQYARYKNKAEQCSAVAESEIGDEWEALKSKIDETTNADMGGVYLDIVQNTGLDVEQKKAAISYVNNLMKMRGYNIRTMIDAKEEIAEDEGEKTVEAKNEEVMDEAYLRGLSADNQERQDIATELSMTTDPDKKKELQASMNGVFAAIKEELDTEAAVRHDEVNKKEKYINIDEKRKAEADGVRYDNNNEGIDPADYRANGTIVPITIFDENLEGEIEGGYLIEGNVQMDEDGKVDEHGSDNIVSIFNPKSGEIEMVPPASIIKSVGEPTLLADEHAAIDEEISNRYSAAVDGVLGKVRVNVGEPFTMPNGQSGEVLAVSGDDVTIRLDDGTQTSVSLSDMQRIADEQRIADYEQRHGVEDDSAVENTDNTDGNTTESSDLPEGYVKGAPKEYVPSLEIIVRDESGNDVPSIVVGRFAIKGARPVDDENGNVIGYYMDDGEVHYDHVDNLNKKVVGYYDSSSNKNEEVSQSESDVNDAAEEAVEPAANAAGAVAGVDEVGRIDKVNADAIVDAIKRFAEVADDVELTPDNWISLFGESGEIETPIGVVKMGENQYFKMARSGRNGKLGMVKPTLERPDFIIEDINDNDTSHERNSSYVFVKGFTDKEGNRTYYFTSVTVSQDGREVVVSNQEKRGNRISKLLQSGKVVWKNEKFSLHPISQVEESVPLSETNKPTNTDTRPALLGINSPELSDGKSTNNSDTDQINDEKSPAEVEYENAVNAFGEKASRKIKATFDDRAADLEKKKKALDKAQNNFDDAPIGKDEKAKKALEKAQKEYEEAKTEYDLWAEVKALDTKRANEEMARRAAEDERRHDEAVEAEQKRQAEEIAKREEQAARGANVAHSSIAEKWNNAEKIEGGENEIVLANGERLAGRYMLVESGAATPSHNPNAEFVKNEGFPVDENGNTVNDRDYERDKMAQRITRDMAAKYDARALNDVPIVSREGVVMSGNGRTMAGELAASNGTDGDYIAALRKTAYRFGLSAEQVDRMKHPRVVFMADEDLPYTTETFAKFNKDDKKSQGRAERSVKMGKVVDDNTFGRIVRRIGAFDTINEFYNDEKAAADAVKELYNAGAIDDMQMAEMFDGEKVSAIGRQRLEDVIIGKAFDNDPESVRMLEAYPAMRQSMITALSEILDNKSLGEYYNLGKELSEAIKLAYDALNSGYKHGEHVSGFALQTNLFSFDEGVTVADYTNLTVMMLADRLNSSKTKDLKNALALYNSMAKDAAAGQIDIFSSEVRSKEEIIKEVLTTLNYGTREEIESRVARATEQRKQGSAREEAESVQQDDAAEDGDRAGRYSGSAEERTEGEGEFDENGRRFVEAPDGSTIFGNVSEDSGLPPAPIKLSEGFQDGNNKGYGLAHIQGNHFGQIQKEGFNSVQEFVSFVAQNYDPENIRVGKRRNGKPTYLLQVTDSHENTLFIELSKDGSYWNVNSGGVFRIGYSNKKETVAKTEPKQPNNVISDDSSLSSGTETDIAPNKPNGESTVSGGKDTKNFGTDKKNVENPDTQEEIADLGYIESGIKTDGPQQQKAEGGVKEVSAEQRMLTEALVNLLNGGGMEASADIEEGQRILDEANGRVQMNAADSKRRKEREKELDVKAEAISIVTGKSKKEVRRELADAERERREKAKEVYDIILSGEYNDVSLQKIQDFIDDATPNSEYGRRVSERLPQRVERKMLEGKRGDEVEALISRVSESSIPANERAREATRGGIAEAKKILLEKWAKAAGKWHTELSDFTNETEPIGHGNDSDVYPAKDGEHVVKLSRGKNDKRFKSDPDAVTLFNYVFPNSAYRVLGYGDFGKGFVRILEQPIVDFSNATPLTVEERVEYMDKLGFKPINKECTAFSNGELLVADLQKSNIVRSNDGNIRVIDADVKLHTKDVGGNYTYLPVEHDLPQGEGLQMHKADESAPVYYSNAYRAVEGIKQEKATQEQWLAMLQKNGGLKAGEDKWIGLSDWLKDAQRRNAENGGKNTLTKQEILDYIAQNKIEIEEVEYGERELYFDYDYEDGLYHLEGHPEWTYKNVGGYKYIAYLNGKFSFEAYSERVVRSLIQDKIGADKTINDTRLNYTTEGLENKREIALVVPNIEPYNENDEVHFGDAGNGRAVAWVRFGDAENVRNETSDEAQRAAYMKAKAASEEYEKKLYEKYGIARDGSMESFEKFVLAMTPEENAEWNRLSQQEEEAYKNANPTKREKVLVIDEIQSKRHQDGRENGYISIEAANAEQKYYETVRKLDEYKGELEKAHYHYLLSDLNDEEKAKLDRLAEERDEALDAWDSFETSDDSVPDAPFDKNWHELAMKRMLRYAAENGYDKVAWTTGSQQAARYNIGEVLDQIDIWEWNGDEKSIFMRRRGARASENIDIDRDGTIVYSSHPSFGEKGQNIKGIYGKELSEKMMGEEAEKIDDLTVFGGEGMKGFYDQMLPKFMDKYGKKWGVKTSDVELDLPNESDRVMHSVDVTPEMKESVMEGQPMFFKTEDGEVYGFVKDGKIYIDPRIATAETPIHEYTHLWTASLRKANPKAWEQLKKLMAKEKELMDYVEKKYPELKGNEDAMMDEVFAHYSGKRGKERLDSEMKAEMDKANGVFEKAKIAEIFGKIKAALDMFWNMARDLFAGSVKGLNKMKAEDFADMAMNDLLNGFNPKNNNGISAAEQKTLMGVHNISEEKLRKALKNGGFANPSVAVVDTRKGGHSDYGEITLIPTSSLMLEKQRGRNAGTWMADAWTPTYPHVNIMPGKGTEKAYKQIREEWSESEPNEEIKNKLMSNLRDYVDANDRDHTSNLKYQFLKEKGMQPQVYDKTNDYDKDFYAFLQNLSKETGVPIRDLVFSEHGDKVGEYYGRMKAEESIGKAKGDTPDDVKKKIVDDFVSKWKENKGRLNYVVDDIYRLAKRPEKETDVVKTFTEAEFTVNTSSELRKEYEQWMSALDERLGMEEKLFTGYTPSGNRRYVANTLENASKLMNKGGQAGNFGWGGDGPFIAKIAEQANTLDKMRKNKDKLIGKDQKFLHEEARQHIRDEFFDLSQVLNKGYGRFDSVGEARMEEIAGMKGDIRGYLKREYGVEVSDEWMQRYNDLVNYIRNEYPVYYFETKFNRPVELWEFSNAIVPKDASDDVVEGLKRAGVNVTFYDKEVKGDRERVVNEVADNTGVKFHKADDSDLAKPEVRDAVEELKDGKSVKAYRAMQMVDGKLYPPMAAVVEGKYVEPTEPGDLHISDERPDLAKNGKFKLNKGNGSSVDAAYNPYFHTSKSPLNDQFSSAWNRPNLVTVEVEIPESELTSGYKAEGAKDAVGETEWKSGPVSGKLAKAGNPRKVILSRYCKVNRVLDDAEVAERIADMLAESGVDGIPFNTVTPSLREELVKAGVKITEPQKGNAGDAARGAYEEWKRTADAGAAGEIRFSENEEIDSNIKSGLSALERLSNGEEEVEGAMRRDELAQMGGTAEISFIWGKPGHLTDKGRYKGGEGFQKIVEKHGIDDAIKVIETIAKGTIGEPYGADGGRRVDIDLKDHHTTVSLYRFGESKSWVLTGYTIDKNADAKGRGSDLSNATQNDPIRTRAELGAALKSAAKLRNIFGTDKKNVAERDAVRVASDSLNTKVRIVEDVNELTDATERQKYAKGWFNVSTGEVVVVFPNCTSVEDAIATVAHETIGHKGMRELLGDNYDAFLDEIYKHLNGELKRRVDESMTRGFINDMKSGIESKRRTAVDELFAEMAEKPFEEFSKEEQTFWQKLKATIREWLDKLLGGAKLPSWFEVGDNEIRYMLWRSKEKLERGKQGPVDYARDIVKRGELGIDELRFRDGETDDIWKDGSIGLQEKMTAAAIRLAENHKGDVDLRNSAMKAIGTNLMDLKKAASAQKELDKATVKRVSDLARVMISGGYLSDLNKGDMLRLISVVKNSLDGNIGAEVKKMMDIMTNNQLGRAKRDFESLLKIKGGKVDARGIEVQGKLDAKGQAVMKVFKDFIKRDSEEIDNALADAMNRLSSEDKIEADNAALEYEGLLLAKDYAEAIKDSMFEADDISREMRSASRRTDADKEYYQSLEEALTKNKVERIQSYYELIDKLGERLGESAAEAERFIEQGKERIKEIHHNANSDLLGRNNNEHRVDKTSHQLINGLANTLFSPLGTFEQMMRLFGSRSANGEGYLYDRFMRGFVDARDKEITGYRGKRAILDAKVKELFGGKINDVSKLIRGLGKMPSMEVKFQDGSEMKSHLLSQGNLMYIYMVNKMTDGKMKLRKMGIIDSMVEDITDMLDPRVKAFADWLQEEFLVNTRNEYNETHKRLFGASMASIENYFPLKINQGSRNKTEDELNAGENANNDGISTKTGSIIKRRMNNTALDLLNANALEVIVDHIAKMEHWNAFAEYNRDLNTLRTYKNFENKVKNMKTIYGTGDVLWKRFNDVCQITVGSYRPKTASFDKGLANVAKGVTAAKVSFRVFTALKQLLSAPAYISEARPDYLMMNLAMPREAFLWSLENLPIFEERFKSRMSGDPRLMKTDADWKMWRNNVMQIASRIGMSPNAFVDAVTVSIGAHSIYQTKLAKYKREGYNAEEADKRAKQDAEIAFNLTQQSSEGAFLSPMQVDRTWFSIMFSVFRNSSMSYQRQNIDAMRNLIRNANPNNYDDTIEFMKKKYIRDGIEEEQAERNAKRNFWEQNGKDVVRLGVFGYLLQYLWALGGHALYLIFGKDDDEKEKIMQEAAVKGRFGFLEGLAGGDVLSEAGKMIVMDEVNSRYVRKDMPLTSDIYNTIDKFQYGKTSEGLNDIINIVVQAGIGVDPRSIEDAVLAIIESCGYDVKLANEASLFAMKVVNAPQKEIEKMYFDEIDMTGEEALRITPTELAERYARYKVKRGNLYTPNKINDEGLIEKEMQKARKLERERIDRAGGNELNERYAEYESQYNEVSAQVKAANKEKNENFQKYAEMMRYIQSDAPKYEVYQIFKKLDKDLDKLSKKFLEAKTIEEAEAYRKAIPEFKRHMVNALDSIADNESMNAEIKRAYDVLYEVYGR